MQYPVIIVDYDPKWPELFEEEKKVLNKLFSKGIIAIEHVGSTAVPGLAAKPIIDIMIGVESLQEGKDMCLGPLQEIGYHYVPELEGDIPERCFLFRGSSQGHSHHIHITEPTTTFWMDHILFRDYLRKYKEVAAAYAELKHTLAKEFRTQREKYGKAKTDFIEGVLEKARAEFS